MRLEHKVRNVIRNVPDFPSPGIQFKDITPLLMDQGLCGEVIDYFVGIYSQKKVDAIVAVESRGFLFGTLLANRLNILFIPARKKGKLPYHTISAKYKLEYGEAEMEMHRDAIDSGWNVLIHDDLLATGGTADATAKLVRKSGANIVAFSFIIELEFLGGRNRITSAWDTPVHSIVNYR